MYGDNFGASNAKEEVAAVDSSDLWDVVPATDVAVTEYEKVVAEGLSTSTKVAQFSVGANSPAAKN
jgi:hypothetical protein